MDKLLMVEALEKGRLLKEALKIIDKLAENDLADMDGEFTINEFDYEQLQNLIIKSRTLKKDRWWDLT
jgi:hypothetical protein